ncbi:MAG: hypothetical protein Q9195_005491 [Heterodermia aff. obscurata]
MPSSANTKDVPGRGGMTSNPSSPLDGNDGKDIAPQGTASEGNKSKETRLGKDQGQQQTQRDAIQQQQQTQDSVPVVGEVSLHSIIVDPDAFEGSSSMGNWLKKDYRHEQLWMPKGKK